MKNSRLTLLAAIVGLMSATMVACVKPNEVQEPTYGQAKAISVDGKADISHVALYVKNEAGERVYQPLKCGTKLKIVELAMSGDTMIVMDEILYDNNTAKLDLSTKKMNPTAPLSQFVQIFVSEAKLSNPETKITMISPNTVMPNGKVEVVAISDYSATQPKVSVKGAYFYSDSDCTATGTKVSGKNEIIVNMNVRKGWNTMVETLSIKDGKAINTVSANNLPTTGMNWTNSSVIN